jgi:hypothetical protein
MIWQKIKVAESFFGNEKLKDIFLLPKISKVEKRFFLMSGDRLCRDLWKNWFPY